MIKIYFNENDKEYTDSNDMFLPKIISKINVSSTEQEIKKDLGDENEIQANQNDFKSVETSTINTENMSLTNLEEIYGKDNIETRLEWMPELIWFIFWHDDMYNLDKFKNTFEKYNNYFVSDLLEMKNKYNTNYFDSIILYHTGSYIC